MLVRLLNGELDILLAPLRTAEVDHEALFTETLLTGDMVVLGRREHPLATRPDVSLRTLAEERWVLPVGAYIRERFDGLFVQHGIDPPVPTVQITDSPGLFDIVANTELLTYVPELRFHRRAPLFAKIRSSQATVSRDTGLIWRQQQPLPPLAVELLTHLRACLREAGDDLYSSATSSAPS